MKVHIHYDETEYDEAFASVRNVYQINDDMIMIVVDTLDKYVNVSTGSQYTPEYQGVMLDFLRFPDNHHDDAENMEWTEFRRSHMVVETDFDSPHVDVVALKHEYHILIMNSPWRSQKFEIHYDETLWQEAKRRSAQIDIDGDDS